MIVGLGSSAGGLEAILAFITGIKENPGCVIVVMQHLSPDYTSMLTEILSRSSYLPVATITHDIKPLLNTIYVTPPNKDVIYRDDILVLANPSNRIGPKPSINRMFESMAEAADYITPVGVVLSGTGTDGSNGLVAIKAVGGFTIVQEPTSARYDGMPLSCIHANCVDMILEPKEIAKVVHEGCNNNFIHFKSGIDTSKSTYYQIIDEARKVSGIDFTNYKPATTERRISRRMAAIDVKSPEDYLNFIKSNHDEINTFAKECLIVVTEFMRDKNLFKELSEYLKNFIVNPDKLYRIWVPGCATGEEAYSIAMILDEIFQAQHNYCRYRIFATDLDEGALAIARHGVYTKKQCKNLSKAQLSKYFDEEPNGFYKVSSYIREKITFSKHNLIQDPPFAKLDMISCRNLLIYFNLGLQKQVYEIFHYALIREGILFLGKSECAAQSQFFERHFDYQHIYIKNNQMSSRATLTSPPITVASSHIRDRRRKESARPYEMLRYSALESLTLIDNVAVIIVDSRYTLVTMNSLAESYLKISGSVPSLKIESVIIEPLRAELKASIFKVLRNKNPIKIKKRSYKVAGSTVRLSIVVTFFEFEMQNHVVIAIKKHEEQVVAQSGDEVKSEEHIIIGQLQDEIISTKESLQTVIEELETTNEELQAANEEAQSSNEELQSMNEELQTTNEELQSANEELVTVNDEILQKNISLEKIKFEFSAVFSVRHLVYFAYNKEFRINLIHNVIK